jgi:hypothetical protein
MIVAYFVCFGAARLAPIGRRASRVAPHFISDLSVRRVPKVPPPSIPKPVTP